MTKGIAISKVVLLILGVIVLAFVGYLVYTTFVAGGGTISLEACKSAVIAACTQCKLKGWSATSSFSVSASVCTTDMLNKIGFSLATLTTTCDKVKDSCKNTFGIE